MKKVVTFGEIMLRLTPPGYRRFSQANAFDVIYGGGESNVAVSLASFGMDVEFVSRLPLNDLGENALMELRKRNVVTKNIARGGERLGLYFLEMGASFRGSKVIYDRSHSAFSTLEKGMFDWEEIFAGADWFHWTGITPAVSQGAAAVCLEAIKTANKMGITVSTDLNYREKLWNYGKSASEVMPGLVEGCDIIMGNEEDAEKHFGISAIGVDVKKAATLNHDSFASVGKQLMEKFPRAKKVIISLRASIDASHNNWTGVLYNGDALLKGPDYEIKPIVDRVGGGDSFMAGLIYGFKKYNDDQKALDFAVAASCLKHSIYGDANLVSVAEVEKLMDGDRSGRVNR
jgi:2-dehydro-3-deoxygluconokinase